jgi:hypothetical protein
MLKKTITYTDYNGNKRTEDFYFNLNKVEVSEMEASRPGGFSQAVKEIVDAKDDKQIIQIFKEVILKAYGEKSPDGKRFIKSEEISEAFSQTEAYCVLFTEIGGSEEAAEAFMNGLISSWAPQVPVGSESK